jgi:hypothetical protein
LPKGRKDDKKMKNAPQYYKAKLRIYENNHNIERIYESNDIELSKEMFEQMEKAVKNKDYQAWSLTLERHLPRNVTQIIKMRSSNGSNVDSPLF